MGLGGRAAVWKSRALWRSPLSGTMKWRQVPPIPQWSTDLWLEGSGPFKVPSSPPSGLCPRSRTKCEIQEINQCTKSRHCPQRMKCCKFNCAKKCLNLKEGNSQTPRTTQRPHPRLHFQPALASLDPSSGSLMAGVWPRAWVHLLLHTNPNSARLGWVWGSWCYFIYAAI